jgi:hypothetical protein
MKIIGLVFPKGRVLRTQSSCGSSDEASRPLAGDGVHFTTPMFFRLPIVGVAPAFAHFCGRLTAGATGAAQAFVASSPKSANEKTRSFCGSFLSSGAPWGPLRPAV